MELTLVNSQHMTIKQRFSHLIDSSSSAHLAPTPGSRLGVAPAIGGFHPCSSGSYYVVVFQPERSPKVLQWSWTCRLSLSV